ncbi:hypothetical protein GALMADRAFT_47566, partial [Galerina marginata CBS 339.88]
TWNPANSIKFSLVNDLSLSVLPSQAILHIDPLIVNALFGQQKQKSQNRSHNIQTISFDTNMEPFGHSMIWSMFEKVKHNLNFQDQLGYIATVKKLSTNILLHYPALVWENKKKESLDTLFWWVKPLGHAKQKGFAIYANKDIIQGEYIEELLGLMPEDRAEKYTDLSTITPHDDNRNDGSFEEKLLIGPIRFINHRCVSYNVEFIAIRNTYAFTIMATKNIKAKEEILLCYGVDYFKE